jgi:hypothetical protein
VYFFNRSRRPRIVKPVRFERQGRDVQAGGGRHVCDANPSVDRTATHSNMSNVVLCRNFSSAAFGFERLGSRRDTTQSAAIRTAPEAIAPGRLNEQVGLTRFIDAERRAVVASHLNVKHTLSRHLAARLRGGRGRIYVQRRHHGILSRADCNPSPVERFVILQAVPANAAPPVEYPLTSRKPPVPPLICRGGFAERPVYG